MIYVDRMTRQMLRNIGDIRKAYHKNDFSSLSPEQQYKYGDSDNLEKLFEPTLRQLKAVEATLKDKIKADKKKPSLESIYHYKDRGENLKRLKREAFSSQNEEDFIQRRDAYQRLRDKIKREAFAHKREVRTERQLKDERITKQQGDFFSSIKKQIDEREAVRNPKEKKYSFYRPNPLNVRHPKIEPKYNLRSVYRQLIGPSPNLYLLKDEALKARLLNNSLHNNSRLKQLFDHLNSLKRSSESAQIVSNKIRQAEKDVTKLRQDNKLIRRVLGIKTRKSPRSREEIVNDNFEEFSKKIKEYQKDPNLLKKKEVKYSLEKSKIRDSKRTNLYPEIKSNLYGTRSSRTNQFIERAINSVNTRHGVPRYPGGQALHQENILLSAFGDDLKLMQLAYDTEHEAGALMSRKLDMKITANRLRQAKQDKYKNPDSYFLRSIPEAEKEYRDSYNSRRKTEKDYETLVRRLRQEINSTEEDFKKARELRSVPLPPIKIVIPEKKKLKLDDPYENYKDILHPNAKVNPNIHNI